MTPVKKYEYENLAETGWHQHKRCRAREMCSYWLTGRGCCVILVAWTLISLVVAIYFSFYDAEAIKKYVCIGGRADEVIDIVKKDNPGLGELLEVIRDNPIYGGLTRVDNRENGMPTANREKVDGKKDGAPVDETRADGVAGTDGATGPSAATAGPQDGNPTIYGLRYYFHNRKMRVDNVTLKLSDLPGRFNATIPTTIMFDSANTSVITDHNNTTRNSTTPGTESGTTAEEEAKIEWLGKTVP